MRILVNDETLRFNKHSSYMDIYYQLVSIFDKKDIAVLILETNRRIIKSNKHELADELTKYVLKNPGTYTVVSA